MAERATTFRLGVLHAAATRTKPTEQNIRHDMCSTKVQVSRALNWLTEWGYIERRLPPAETDWATALYEPTADGYELLVAKRLLTPDEAAALQAHPEPGR